MNDISYTELLLAAVGTLALITLVLSYAFSLLIKLEGRLKRLEQLYEYKVSKYVLDHTKKRFDKRISALEDYLGVEIVEERARPERIVAKKIGDQP
jgi:uncharacterized membrane protein